MEQQQSSIPVPASTSPQPPAAPAAATHIVVQPTMPAPQMLPKPDEPEIADLATRLLHGEESHILIRRGHLCTMPENRRVKSTARAGTL
jgi:hypothetical protein